MSKAQGYEVGFQLEYSREHQPENERGGHEPLVTPVQCHKGKRGNEGNESARPVQVQQPDVDKYYVVDSKAVENFKLFFISILR